MRVSIRDFDKKWYASELSSAQHPAGFEDNKFLSWWFTYFDDTRNMYHVYVLYIITHFESKAEEYPGIDQRMLEQLSQTAGIEIE